VVILLDPIPTIDENLEKRVPDSRYASDSDISAASMNTSDAEAPDGHAEHIKGLDMTKQPISLLRRIRDLIFHRGRPTATKITVSGSLQDHEIAATRAFMKI
jgi:hypothetical protein